MSRTSRIALAIIVLGLALLSLVGCAAEDRQPAGPTATPGVSPCAVKSDMVLLENAVGPSWIEWDSPCLPDADLVYVDRDTWDIWVMDEHGENRRCLTCYGHNILGVNFPLDDDGQSPAVHWKGDPEAHPTQPVILFKAENENSGHKVLQNAPSFGWDNDIWALNVCTGRYSRLTNVAAGQGVQNTGMSNDGQWYVYPLRYESGKPLQDFGLARMVFNELSVDENGDAHFLKRFEGEPNGQMYYEPHDIQRNDAGTYTLLYSAGTGNKLDLYTYEWRCEGENCPDTNKVLQTTPFQHEEFAKFSFSGTRIAWMKGPQVGFGYQADLYVSTPAFTDIERVTWYNDCEKWPDRCKPNGAQLSRLDWNGDGTAVFYGLWIHSGPLQPPNEVELHRLDFAGPCGQ
ncbi:MAG: hypothetical protein KJ734_13165 [Chloroflexi bacterium]|nr:hypothetical protein [Chloroflexota bacterium]